MSLIPPSAECGDSESQFNLGMCYKNGDGVTKDETEAVQWFRLAADQENTSSHSNLGVAYIKGNEAP
jgi:TPR repeat protein